MKTESRSEALWASGAGQSTGGLPPLWMAALRDARIAP